MRPAFRAVLAALLLPALPDLPAGAQENPADAAPGKLRIALVNMKCRFTDGPDGEANRKNLRLNLDRHLYFIDRICKEGVDFIGFPELSLNGYRFSKDMTWLRLDGPELGELARKAAEKRVYIAAGLAEEDAAGKRWNAHVILGPDGKLVGRHAKIVLTQEKGFTEAGTVHAVFDVKGVKVGIATCGDGSYRENLKALVDNGAQLIYAPHANVTGSTVSGWYNFRRAWVGPSGWIAEFKVYAALHNHAARYSPEFDPPAQDDTPARWASGARVIGPDGAVLAEMPPSTNRADSREFILRYDLPLGGGRK
ncbi:MAG TPA: carbon-nitrogen hydrolase family protein [Planctomycetota bacterium]|nr:carbon-nitrogen hydrolase family protein [Planctomycetota bacterium]